MDVLGRYRNLIVLVGVLFAQVLGLAVQVKRTNDSESTRLIRVWAVGAVTPLENALGWVQNTSGNIWHNYCYLRGVRAENRNLKSQIERMTLEQVRLSQDAGQARRLQALLAFKEQFISQTLAAQVIGASGSETSRSVYIDKGYNDGIRPDMAVITAEGVVGKVLRADPANRHVAHVLLIDDQTSGVGAILDKTRLQGIVRGTPSGEVVLEKVMSDETVSPGDVVLTSGGDGIFPKGLPVGRVTNVAPGSDLFLNIRVRPAANLGKLEEVLVVTKIDERQAEPDQNGAARAVDILAERLPGVPAKTDDANKNGVSGAAATGLGAATAAAPAIKNSSAKPETKPGAQPDSKTAPPQASATNRAPSPSKPASAAASPGPGHATATAAKSAPPAADAAKVVAKPVKAADKPKPPPTAEDTPN